MNIPGDVSGDISSAGCVKIRSDNEFKLTMMNRWERLQDFCPLLSGSSAWSFKKKVSQRRRCHLQGSKGLSSHSTQWASEVVVVDQFVPTNGQKSSDNKARHVRRREENSNRGRTCPSIEASSTEWSYSTASDSGKKQFPRHWFDVCRYTRSRQWDAIYCRRYYVATQTW